MSPWSAARKIPAGRKKGAILQIPRLKKKSERYPKQREREKKRKLEALF